MSLSNQEVIFMKRVAMRLIEQGIENPTHDEITAAMEYTLARDQEIHDFLLSNRDAMNLVSDSMMHSVWNKARDNDVLDRFQNNEELHLNREQTVRLRRLVTVNASA